MTDGHLAPDAVRHMAASGLSLHRLGYGGKGLTQGAIDLGQKLALGRPVTTQDIKVLYAYFARMSKNSSFQESMKRDPTSPANVSWLLRGGTPALAWVGEIWIWEKDLPSRCHESRRTAGPPRRTTR